MGRLNDERFTSELENGVKICHHDKVSFEGVGNGTSIEDAVKVLLIGLGEDVNREGIRKTPHRVAKAFREGTIGYAQSAKEIVQDALFPEAGLDNKVGQAGGVGGLVIVRDLDFFSYCESCLLPFQVKCHVGYVPSGQRVLGLSKFSRVAGVFVKRLQEPQRLADEICSALHHGVEPEGVAVILQCAHISPFLASPNQGWVKTLVSSGSGVFKDKNADKWAEFFGLVKFRGIDIEEIHSGGSSDLFWCPSLSPLSDTVSSLSDQPVNPAMATAVASIIKSLGEDPLRKELRGTPSRFVKWLMNFQTGDLGVKLNGSLSGRGALNANGQGSFNGKRLYSELNIPFWSQCEHHLLPFHGVVHIGYFISDGLNPIEKSLLESVVHFYGFKLQVQERLTRQIAETISPLTLDGDVIVVVEASHSCMISRGIEKFGSNTATIAVLGRFSTDVTAKTSFLNTIPSYASS